MFLEILEHTAVTTEVPHVCNLVFFKGNHLPYAAKKRNWTSCWSESRSESKRQSYAVNTLAWKRRRDAKMHCIYTLWETLFPIIKTSTPTVKYGGHCLRYRHTLVGKNYLLLYPLWKTLLPIMLSGWEVYMHPRAGTAETSRGIKSLSDVLCVSRYCSKTNPVSVLWKQPMSWELLLTVVCSAVSQHVHFC